MTPERWERVKGIVQDALAQPPAAREAWVTTACRGDAELVRDVESLLAAHEQAGSFIERPALARPEMAAALDALQGTPTWAGRRVGPYVLVREIGHGGMGAVYLAVRADDAYRKQVAIKVIRSSFDAAFIQQRFRHERQILADLDHPAIARLIDGGSTEDGAPYFVMEYVDGLPIDQYCHVNHLSIEARLALFQRVCAAVHYAHQRLVVHRDLKANNILVTPDGTTKLLDFGIAKLLHADSDTPEHITLTAMRAMSLESASPEQVRGDAVTTATDVYALGVLLHRLLTGRGPYDVAATTPHDLAREICETDARRPSDVAADTGVARRLRGDLDTIVLKALQKDPVRRYSSVEQFARDVTRHIEGLPVLARPDTMRYRTTKFMARHKVGVAASVVIVVSLVGGSIATARQAHVARLERDKAQRRFSEVRALASAFLFEFHDSIAELNGATQAREMVVKKAQEYLDSLLQEAGDDRGLLWELSTAYLKLGDVQGRPGFSRTGDTTAALQSYEKSLDTRRRLATLEPGNAEYRLGLAVTLSRFGPMFQVLGKPSVAVERMREAVEITDTLLPQSNDFATFQSATRNPAFLGDALSEMGRYDEALAAYQKCLSIAEHKKGSFSTEAAKHRIAVCRERLGLIFGITGDWRRSLDNHLAFLTIEEELSALEPANGEYMRAKATALDHVGDAFRGLRNYPNALEYGRRGLAMYDAFLDKDPRDARAKKDVGDGSHHVAETLLASGDVRGALSLLRRTVAVRRGLVALDATNVEYPDDLADSLMLTGEALAASGNPAKAIEAFQEARAIREPIVSSHRQRVDYRRGLARVYIDLGDALASVKDRGGAEACYRKGLGLWTELQREHVLSMKETNMPKDAGERLARVIHTQSPP